MCASPCPTPDAAWIRETLKRAIEPFFSTKEIGKGTGLGLSMIHGLALQLKGALRLSSDLGHGTRAELWLPVASGAATAVAPEPRRGVGASERHATLLFVDDDFLISLSTAALLEDLGHTVIKAPSGAVPRCAEGRQAGRPHDHRLRHAGHDRPAARRGGARLRPDLPILLATGYADLPTRASFDLPRLSKPYQQKQLAEQITSLLG